MVDNNAIYRRILELVAKNGKDVAKRLAKEFGFSRQTANKHLRTLVANKIIRGEGKTRAKKYYLTTTHEKKKTYNIAGLEEDRVWYEVVSPIIHDLAENVRDIWQYGVTEMVNNAIDHSGSADVYISVYRNALFSECWVLDNGEGIFNKIQKALGFFDPRESILELAKGKLTTDPENHTGEGIFFSSRIFDVFDIISGKLHFMHTEQQDDYLFESEPERAEFEGTAVFMRLANNSERLIADVFNEFAAPEEYSFTKTVVPVRLAQYEGEKLISRSQAKRLYQRFEKFRRVVLDFHGVAEIGQAFADELFRVFPKAHPSVQLAPVNTSKAVADMIKRVLKSVA